MGNLRLRVRSSFFWLWLSFVLCGTLERRKIRGKISEVMETLDWLIEVVWWGDVRGVKGLVGS